MIEFFDLLPTDVVEKFVSSAAKSDLASYLIVVGVIWRTMGKKVAGHFAAMETAVKDLTKQVGLLRTDFVDSTKQTGSRLDALEGGMLQLRSRVMTLEKKPPQGASNGTGN